jgi:hypothetical protein
MALPSWLLVFVGGRRSKRPGPSPTLGSLGPSHQWRHKSRVSLRGPPCAHSVAGTPHGEVRDRNTGWRLQPCCNLGTTLSVWWAFSSTLFVGALPCHLRRVPVCAGAEIFLRCRVSRCWVGAELGAAAGSSSSVPIVVPNDQSSPSSLLVLVDWTLEVVSKTWI